MSASTCYKIEAIIRPNRLEAVQEALYDIGQVSFTVTEVRGTGRQTGIGHTFRGSQYAQNLLPRVKIELFLPHQAVEDAIEAIQLAATTGEVGDGKIVAFPVPEVIRIRTGERGAAAID